MPSNKCYFSKNPILLTPIFGKLLSESRFIPLMKFLHFNDNSKYDESKEENKKIFKILPIINHLKNKFQANYIPKREICIDESLMKWKGRLSFKVYMPLKSAKFGIKFYELCESDSSYVWNFFIYTGKTTAFEDDIKDEMFSTKVVLQLIKPLLDKGYRVTMDNFFTSSSLFNLLVSRNTDCLGTIRINRNGIPNIIKDTKIARDHHLIMYRGNNIILNR